LIFLSPRHPDEAHDQSHTQSHDTQPADAACPDQ
jgi:hypothetical protein